MLITRLKQVNALTGAKQKALVFAVAFLAVFALVRITNAQPLQYDAAAYYNLADTFVEDGVFALTNYPDTVRGVIFPLLIFVFKQVAGLFSQNPMMAWWLMVSTLVAVLTVALPGLFGQLRRGAPTLPGYGFLIFCLLFFWFGSLSIPSSDVVAVALFAIGAVFLQKSGKEGQKLWPALAFAVLSGAFLYMAYNTRTIYLFSTLALVLFTMAVRLVQKRNILRSVALPLAFLALGVVAVGTLEAEVNFHHYKRSSIEVITSGEHYKDGVFAFQLKYGLPLSQYETYLGDPTHYPTPDLRFIDPMGAKLLEMMDAGEEIWGSPSKMAVAGGVYLRHFINMLNPVWGGGHITNLIRPKLPRSLLNFSMLFLLAKQVALWLRGKRTKNLLAALVQKGSGMAFVGGLLVTCVAILPGAVEQRFFLPFYVVLYGLVAFCLDYKTLWQQLRKRPVVASIQYAGVYIFLLLNWATTYFNTGMGVPLSPF